jgi:dTDP-4-dehydrorhamnose 3,5-epimerase
MTSKECIMKFSPTSIADIILIEPHVYGDERGFFLETYQAKRFKEAGISALFVQDNHSGSRQGTLRGLHFQIRQPQGKLIRVIQGEVYDVAVDLRRSSPTFGQWEGTYLSAENRLQIWIPGGFAHGFYVISPWAELVYKVTDFYAPEWERTLLWNDGEIDIQWPLLNDQNPILSSRDAMGLPFSDVETFD